MSNNRGISVRILGKEFQVNCPDGAEHKLIDAAQLLDKKMAEIRNHGRVIGLERIAIMAALNICHENLEYRSQQDAKIHDTQHRIKRMHDKIEDALFFSGAEKAKVTEEEPA